MTDNPNNLMPSGDDDIRQILNQVMKAQAEASQSLGKIPVYTLQAWVGLVINKALNRINGEYNKARSEFAAETEKAIKRLGDKLDDK